MSSLTEQFENEGLDVAKWFAENAPGKYSDHYKGLLVQDISKVYIVRHRSASFLHEVAGERTNDQHAREGADRRQGAEVG